MANSFDNGMTGQSVIILGSARSDGYSAQMAHRIATRIEAKVIDLKNYEIAHYDYNHNYKNDDFIELIQELVIQADTLILATPVYWYSMSGRMKVFLDRFTDLLKVEKDLGRQLRGKSLAVFTTSNGGNLGDDFWIPFIETAGYLGMKYLANAHYLDDDLDQEGLELDFVNNLLTTQSNL